MASESVDLRNADVIKGKFIIAGEETGWTNIFYELSPERSEAAGEDPDNPTKIPLLRINPDGDQVIISPVTTHPNERFLKPKYSKLETITLEGFDLYRPEHPDDVAALLEELPSGFVKDPEFGLGLLKDYRYIVDAVETVPGVKHLVLSRSRATTIDRDVYVLAATHYNAVRKAINRTHVRALKLARIDKSDLTYNSLLHELDGTNYPAKHRPYAPNTIFRAVTGAPPKLSDDDQLAAVTLVKQNRQSLADRHPEQLMELQRDIELVTLERLIEKLDALMAKDTAEHLWQKLLIDNPFILSLAFGLPVIAIGGQVSVGGSTFFGTGEKITDFLVKNDLTDNLTLIEIKTPRTKLLASRYREGVFPPSADLAGSVTQILDQRYRLQAELNSKKVNTRRYDMEAYAVRCVVIIGTTPAEPDQKKSFELFRNNLHDTMIITFDELLEKLRHLHKFLRTPDPSV